MELYNQQTIEEKYGISLSSLSLNDFQKIAYDEFNLGTISKETIDESIRGLDEKISQTQDPKIAKDLTKKKENLQSLYQREQKPISMDKEDIWSSYFDKVDDMINGLDQGLRTKLVSNVLINENPMWHKERNSLVHIKIVTSRGIATGDDDLVRSAIFHDIAKFDTLTFNAKGWPTCQGHDALGARLAVGENQLVQWICQNHMKVKGWRGDAESPGMKENTKREMFLSSPGETMDDKAKSFWKLCQFSMMDDMNSDFGGNEINYFSNNIIWENPGIDNWDQECPLRHMYSKSELVQQENQAQKPKPELTFTAKEIMDMGAKGPQIGKILKEITGKTREEALEIINRELVRENRSWIKTFEKFRFDFR